MLRLMLSSYCAHPRQVLDELSRRVDEVEGDGDGQCSPRLAVP